MKNRQLLLACFGLAILLGCSQKDAREPTDDPKTDPSKISVSDIARDYQSFRLITPKPVAVDPIVAALCRARTVETARERSGPHAFTLIQIYMNDLAADEFPAGPSAYPIGSVIVKQKQPDQSRPMDKEGALSGVGGMVKREPGYDPDNGDWEYFYFDTPENIESGRMKNCIECHQRAKQTDYVFGHWHRLVKE